MPPGPPAKFHFFPELGSYNRFATGPPNTSSDPPGVLYFSPPLNANHQPSNPYITNANHYTALTSAHPSRFYEEPLPTTTSLPSSQAPTPTATLAAIRAQSTTALQTSHNTQHHTSHNTRYHTSLTHASPRLPPSFLTILFLTPQPPRHPVSPPPPPALTHTLAQHGLHVAKTLLFDLSPLARKTPPLPPRDLSKAFAVTGSVIKSVRPVVVVAYICGSPNPWGVFGAREEAVGELVGAVAGVGKSGGVEVVRLGGTQQPDCVVLGWWARMGREEREEAVGLVFGPALGWDERRVRFWSVEEWEERGLRERWGAGVGGEETEAR